MLLFRYYTNVWEVASGGFGKKSILILSVYHPGVEDDLGSQKKIIPHLACLLARLLRYIHRHVSRYAPLDVPCRRTQIRRNLVELFLSATLNLKLVKDIEKGKSRMTLPLFVKEKDLSLKSSPTDADYHYKAVPEISLYGYSEGKKQSQYC